MSHRSETGPDGPQDQWNRNASGQFGVGNKGGPGAGSLARKTTALRAALLEAVTAEDIKAIVEKLVEDAKAGSIQAAHEILDRCLGKPEAVDLALRITELEEYLEALAPKGRGAR